MEIQIKNVTAKTSKGGKAYWVVTDENSVGYTCWDEAVGKLFHDNQNHKADIQFEDKNGFKTITSATVIEPGETSEPKPTYPSKDASIVAQCLTKVLSSMLVTENDLREDEKFKFAMDRTLEAYNYFLERL